MAQIFRVEKTKNFTIMSNHHFKNESDIKSERSIVTDVKFARGLELQYARTGNTEQRWD